MLNIVNPKLSLSKHNNINNKLSQNPKCLHLIKNIHDKHFKLNPQKQNNSKSKQITLTQRPTKYFPLEPTKTSEPFSNITYNLFKNQNIENSNKQNSNSKNTKKFPKSTNILKKNKNNFYSNLENNN